MQEYIERLIRCGLSPCNAYITYHDFLRKYGFSHKELDEFINSMETDTRIKVEELCG